MIVRPRRSRDLLGGDLQWPGGACRDGNVGAFSREMRCDLAADARW
jgi:hypothetical protein